MKKLFNAIKKEQLPWIYEVTKYASQQPFIYLQRAFSDFFKGKSNYPTFKKKGRCRDSFYVGGDQVVLQLFQQSAFRRVGTAARQFVAHAMPLDVMSAGVSPEAAREALDEAVRLFLLTAQDHGTLPEVLAEGGADGRELELLELEGERQRASQHGCEHYAPDKTTTRQ